MYFNFKNIIINPILFFLVLFFFNVDLLNYIFWSCFSDKFLHTIVAQSRHELETSELNVVGEIGGVLARVLLVESLDVVVDQVSNDECC